MDNLIKPMLVVAIRKLPFIVSLIIDNKLTSPVALEETPEKVIKASPINLTAALRDLYINELKLLGPIGGHCEKGVYLLLEGELRIFTLAQGPLALKRIMDSIRDIGGSVLVRSYILNLIVTEDNQYEWLDDQ